MLNKKYAETEFAARLRNELPDIPRPTVMDRVHSDNYTAMAILLSCIAAGIAITGLCIMEILRCM